MVPLIVCIITILLFIPIKSNFVHRKRRNQIAEFDLTTEENFVDIFAKNLETKLGRSYELLGHSMCLFFLFK
jgi:hypothetical protein